MLIEDIPEIYLPQRTVLPDLFLYDLKMTEANVKTKVNLNMHMFSFLQVGQKQVHFADTGVLVDNSQSLLIKKGNCLWSELLDEEQGYYCKLLFFTDERLTEFLTQHKSPKRPSNGSAPFITIENDEYIIAYLNSLSTLVKNGISNQLLSIKFDELITYLLDKYGVSFEDFLNSLITQEVSSFRKSVEQKIYSSLSLEEIAFLCNMSLSTFKRRFAKEFGQPPGQWLRDQRLLKAKTLLAQGNITPSQIYLDLGYSNLSNFSNAFKAKFGVSPINL